MSQPQAVLREPILLLKTKSAPHDGYEEYFDLYGTGRFEPKFVPVLEHQFNSSSLATVRGLIETGRFAKNVADAAAAAAADTVAADHDVHGYGGLIFTSQRAVEAFHNIIQDLRAAHGDALQGLLPVELPLYVVGPATAKSVRAIGLPNPVVGEDTGNGEVLAGFMLDHYNSLPGSKLADGTNRALLFMVGEQRRDIIPKTLQSDSLDRCRRIKVVETTVYETRVMESFPNHFSEVIKPTATQKCPRWVVVFSPTGCEAMLRGLDMLDPATGAVYPKLPDRKTFIATIGPTTRDYLKREFSFEPDVCAETPSPGGVGSGIQAFEWRRFLA